METDVCYKPASLITAEQLDKKRETFESRQGTVGNKPALWLHLADPLSPLLLSFPFAP